MRTVLRLLTFALAAAWAAGITGYAHHSFGATYDTNKQIKLSGKLAQFTYRNPHSFVTIDATDESGKPQRWSLEWGGTAQLANAGREARFAQSRRRRPDRREPLARSRRAPRPDGQPDAAGGRVLVGPASRRTGRVALMKRSAVEKRPVMEKPPLEATAYVGSGFSRICILTGVCLLAWAMPIHAQRGAGAGRGNAPATPRAAAPIDLTGYWVSVVTEDWKFRMVTPNTGELGALPLNPEGQKIAKTWDPAKDEAAGEPVPRVRRTGDHAHPRASARDVAGRQHAQDRNRRGHSDTVASLRRSGPGGRAVLAGKLHRTVERGGPQFESRDQQLTSWIRAQERRAVQQQSCRHRILRPQRAAEWRSVADDYHEGRGPDIFHQTPDDQL